MGFAGKIEEISFGTTSSNMTVVKELSGTKAVSILLRGGSQTIIDEAHRSVHDALCVIRNLLWDPRVVVGGGATELSGAIYLRGIAD